MTYAPPGNPAPYGPPPRHPAPPGNGRGKLIAVIVVAVVVALLVCVGGVITTAVVLINQNEESQAVTAGEPAQTAAPVEPAPPTEQGGAGPACGVVAYPDGKAVGRPDFSRAARTGTVTMNLATSQGAITVTMDRAKAPCTVASFEYLAGERFFDDSPCHRLTTDGIYVLQCGDPTGTGTGGPDYQIADENLSGARYTRGVVAMANAGPNTNGSQFFIVYRDSELSPQYTVFGEVGTGLEVVDRVAAGGVREGGNGPGDGQPNLAVTLRSVTVR